MGAVGIVAEYDPFHLGHAYHISETRRRLGACVPVVCVMSGHWTQRGQCALTDKWTRTALALRGGADLVLELPVVWALSSAEGFARGAVETFRCTGVVDALSFGSESGDLEGLRTVAAALDGGAYRAVLRSELDKGKPFAEARQTAARRVVGKPAERLKNPNDSLGVEYLRAAGEDLAAVAAPRKGISHDNPAPSEGFASASHLRALARAGEWEEFSRWTPAGTAETVQRAGVADMRYAERAILAKLRTMTEEDFAALPDCGTDEGLPVRMAKAAGEAATLEAFYALVKTRRFAHSRIRRLTAWAFLGMTAADRPAHPLYLRVLGFNDRGRDLLREMKGRASLPILTKPAHAKRLDGAAQDLFALERRCTDLYGLCFDKIRPCGLDWTTGPVMM